MAWPLSQDYNEAIQDPRISFADPELRQGEVVCNALGIPIPRSGNFADVYEVRSADGRGRWAVKCFTRHIVGLRERYSEISAYLRQTQLPFMVDFQYLEQGIRVRGSWYPVLKMQWVEGFLLNELVRDNLDKPLLLRNLAQIWLRMARKLREARLAHCDLQHGNVILVPGSRAQALAVKLIDYDGMFVPSLAGKKSGEVGHPAYQHPQRLQTGAYHAEVDRFPLLVIATALQGLSVGGRSLWERYDNGDNLLFRQSDLQAPGQSPLFGELRQLRDPLTLELAAHLQQAAQQPLEKTPLLETVFPEERTAAVQRQAARSTSTAAAPMPGEDWDFASGPTSRLLRSRRRRSAGWIWAVGGLAAAAVLLLTVGGLSWLVLSKTGSPVAQKDRAAQTQKKTTEGLARVSIAGQGEAQSLAPDLDKEPEPGKRGAPAGEKDDDRTQWVPLPQGQRDKNELASGGPLQVASAGGANLVAWAREQDKSWHLKDTTGQRTLFPFNGHTAPVLCLAICSDGKRIVTGSADHTVRLWGLETGQLPIHLLEGHDRPVTSVAASPDGRRAASADGSPEVFVWDLAGGTKIRTLTNPAGVTTLAFNDRGDKLLCGLQAMEPGGMPSLACCLWDVASGVQRKRFEAPLDHSVTAAALSPDEHWAVTGEGPTIRLWDLRRSREGKTPVPILQQTLTPQPGAAAPDARSIVFSRDNQHFAVCTKQVLYLYDVKGSAQIHNRSNNDLINACFTADGSKVVLGSRRGNEVGSQQINVPGVTTVVVNPRPRPRPRPQPQPQPASRPARLTAPSKEELARERKRVRENYKESFALLKTQKPDDLLDRLINDAKQSQKESAYCYALLREGFDLACNVGDVGRAFSAITEIIRLFEVEAVAEKLAALETLGRYPRALNSPDLLDKALLTAEDAIKADDYSRAVKLMAVAQLAAQARRSAVCVALVQQRFDRLQMLRKEYKQIEPMVKKLAQGPNDTAASLAVGKFQCFRKGDWKSGLPLLQKGADPTLAQLAEMDIEAETSPTSQLGLADKWWTFGEADKTPLREPIKERARYWYRRALTWVDEEEDKNRLVQRLSFKVGSVQVQPGLVAELFRDGTLNNKVSQRIEYQIDSDWGDRSPDTQVPAEGFSIRYHGWLMVPESGPYHLHVRSQGSYKILIDGRVIHDQWTTAGGNWSIATDLNAGPRRLEIWYRKKGSPASLHFGWMRPAGAPQAGSDLVSLDFLYHEQAPDRGRPRSKDKP